jgi:hypothetical protein
MYAKVGSQIILPVGPEPGFEQMIAQVLDFYHPEDGTDFHPTTLFGPDRLSNLSFPLYRSSAPVHWEHPGTHVVRIVMWRADHDPPAVDDEIKYTSIRVLVTP